MSTIPPASAREIGVRVALGAGPNDVFRIVLSQGLSPALVGLGLGLALSWVLTRFLRGMLYGVTEMDAPTITSVAILLCVVTLVACYIRARRAAKVNPLVALRHE